MSSLFIQRNFLELVYSVVSLGIVGSLYEEKVSSRGVLGIFLLSGLCGNMVGAVLSDRHSLGSSISIVGIWGGCVTSMLHEVLFHYEHMDPQDRQACLGVTLVMELGSIFMVTVLFYSATNDMEVHLAALLFGSLFAYC